MQSNIRKVVFFFIAMKRILISAIVMLSMLTTQAQGSDDALQFSQTYYQGTAKAMGMGNAMGAVGGDMTSICINPAGMGLYRSNEVGMSLSLLDNYNASKYYGTSNGANKMRITLPNVGYIGTKPRSNYRQLRFTHFGITLNRTNEFNIHTHAKGVNPTSSKIDNYLGQIDGYSPLELQNAFPYTIFPAWSTYLIDIYEDELGEYYDSPVPQGGIWQSQENQLKGRSEEWTFAGSANFSERFFIGISAGLCHIKRNGTRTFMEWMPEQATDVDFNQWSFVEHIQSTGWGGNLKLGFIYHANNWLRLGAAFHSPSLYGFEESWQTETESQIQYIKNKYISPESHYEYNFISPLKCLGSMAFIIGERGLVSFDAEYTNYGAARFSAEDWDYSEVNADIKEAFGHTLNFRLGSEWRLQSSYLRFGAGYYGSPYGFGKTDGSVKKASIGLSLPVSESTTFDFGYVLAYSKTGFCLYDAGALGIEPVTQCQFKGNLAVTLRTRY